MVLGCSDQLLLKKFTDLINQAIHFIGKRVGPECGNIFLIREKLGHSPADVIVVVFVVIVGAVVVIVVA